MSEFTVRQASLHVAHSWRGGLSRWVKDFALADSRSRHYVLESIGSLDCYGMGHQLKDAITGEVLDTWILSEPIAEVRDVHTSYKKRLTEVIDRYNVRLVYVSSLIGHSLDAFRPDLPIVRIHHDFFPFCPALHCYFGALCTVCKRENLEACQKSNRHFRPLNSEDYHIELRSKLLDVYNLPNVIHVVPSPAVQRQYAILEERFADMTFHVIEHGIDEPRLNLFGGASEGRRLRVGMLGHLQWSKGLDVLRSELVRLRLVVDLVLLGSGDSSPEFAPRWAVEMVPEYDRSELPDLLRRLRLDMALFLSVVPETFSYTLSEVWSFGIPPLAHAVGAFAERIQHGSNGFLFRMDDDSLVDELLRLDRNRDELRQVSDRLADVRLRTTGQMVQDYCDLLKRLGISVDCETEVAPSDQGQVPQP